MRKVITHLLAVLLGAASVAVHGWYQGLPHDDTNTTLPGSLVWARMTNDDGTTSLYWIDKQDGDQQWTGHPSDAGNVALKEIPEILTDEFTGPGANASGHPEPSTTGLQTLSHVQVEGTRFVVSDAGGAVFDGVPDPHKWESLYKLSDDIVNTARGTTGEASYSGGYPQFVTILKVQESEDSLIVSGPDGVEYRGAPTADVDNTITERAEAILRIAEGLYGLKR